MADFFICFEISLLFYFRCLPCYVRRQITKCCSLLFFKSHGPGPLRWAYRSFLRQTYSSPIFLHIGPTQYYLKWQEIWFPSRTSTWSARWIMPIYFLIDSLPCVYNLFPNNHAFPFYIFSIYTGLCFLSPSQVTRRITGERAVQFKIVLYCGIFHRMFTASSTSRVRHNTLSSPNTRSSEIRSCNRIRLRGSKIRRILTEVHRRSSEYPW